MTAAAALVSLIRYLPDPDLVRFGNAVFAALTLFALTVAIVVEFDRISRAWRRVLFAGVAQQVVILYGSVEILTGGDSELRVYFVFATLVALALAAAGVIAAHRR